MHIKFSVSLVFVAFLFFPAFLSAEAKPIVRIGFPVSSRNELPMEINLAKDQTLGSAFLLQLRRQALLIAARDELGAATRDAFLDETAPEGSLEIPDIDKFPNSNPPYVDHRRFLAELEKRSRNEFVAELRKRGVKKFDGKESDEESDKESEKIDELLDQWALIPQFEALRRLHGEIEQKGETPKRLAKLVRAYTQFQIQTNYAPRDSHRVFQARSMLYAQRLVAKYGATPEHLSLRAAAWSLNNFHRLARLEFEEIEKQGMNVSDDAWIELARLYADFDFKGLETFMETAEPKTRRAPAKMLYFSLLCMGNNSAACERSFAEEAFVDLPDCSRFYTEVYRVNTFDMVYAPDGSPFHEHLARRIAPAVRKMKDLPEEVRQAAKTLGQTVRKPSSGLFGLFGSGNAYREFPLEQYYDDLAELIRTLKETPTTEDSGEPSLSMLAMLLQDETMQLVQWVARGIQGRNGAPESLILPSLPVLESHPAIEYLGHVIRAQELKTPYWHRLSVKSTIPYSMFSLHIVGFRNNFFDSDFHGRFFSPYFFACLYCDRENVRDMVQYHRNAITEYPPGKYYFLVDLLVELCPNNPYAQTVRLVRTDGLGPGDAEAYLERFGETYSDARNSVMEFYEKLGLYEKLVELVRSDFDAVPSRQTADRLMTVYLQLGDREKAVEIMERSIDTPRAAIGLNRSSSMLSIGKILLQDGKIEEAEPYFQPAARTHSAWGLNEMARYLEISGRFEEAEPFWLAELESYQNTIPTGLWGYRYRTNHPDTRETLDVLLDRFARYKAAPAMDTTTLMKNKIADYEVLYPCYCMDIPFPEPLGNDPLADQLLLSGNGVFGFLSWLDAMERKDVKKADRLLNLIREIWFLEEKDDPFVLKQRTVLPKISKRIYVDEPYRRLAALIQQDQRGGKPGNPDPAEVDFIVRASFGHDLDTGKAPWILYLLGRYYDLYENSDAAKDCYRRVLGFRADFNYFLRSLAVKELRKSGMTNEDYVRYSREDPRISPLRYSKQDGDVLCRQHFRDYSDSPLKTVLAYPVAGKTETATNPGKPATFKPGYYRVTKILFRGKAFTEKGNSVYWRIPEKDDNDPDWGFQGIGGESRFRTTLGERRPDGFYPVRLATLRAGACFSGDRLALAVSLHPDKEPGGMSPKPESDCVLIEMKKVSEIPVPEPMIPLPNRSASQASDIVSEDNPAWINQARIAAIGVSCLAVLLALIVSVRRKNKQKTEASPENSDLSEKE